MARMIEKWFPNGINTQFSYNADGTLSRVKNRRGYTDADLVSQHDYLYDGFGNRIQHAETINGVYDVTDYVYDDLMRLVSSTAGGVTNAYQYDILNNRTAVLTTDAQGATTSVYSIFDAANQKTELRGGSATGTLAGGMVYDANGNLTQQCTGGTVTRSATACTGATVTAAAYDFLGRTAQITKTGQPAQSYDYDDQNRRIRKTVGTVVNNYLYQGEDILAEYANGWAAATGFITHGRRRTRRWPGSPPRATRSGRAISTRTGWGPSSPCPPPPAPRTWNASMPGAQSWSAAGRSRSTATPGGNRTARRPREPGSSTIGRGITTRRTAGSRSGTRSS